MAPTELKEAVERVWARGWKPPGEAFGTKEFHGLVRACARLYPGMTPGKTYNPYQEAVENIFLNTPSRFYRKVEQRPQEAAEVIHQAFTQTKWPVTYLVPLDGCPSFPSVVRFGECEVGEFSREEFGTRIGESRWLARSTMEHSEREADRKAEEIGREIGRLSQFQWLVVTGLRSFERLEDRILGGGFGKVGDYFTFGTRTNWNEVDLVLAHSHKYEFCVEQALFCLAMCAWDEIVRITSIHEGWEPFSVPWICEVSDEPLVI
jgi:hypothetical protein